MGFLLSANIHMVNNRIQHSAQLGEAGLDYFFASGKN